MALRKKFLNAFIKGIEPIKPRQMTNSLELLYKKELKRFCSIDYNEVTLFLILFLFPLVIWDQ